MCIYIFIRIKIKLFSLERQYFIGGGKYMDTGKLGVWWVSLIISVILENILNRQIMILSLN